jgi:SPP1 family phage portal protein
MIYKGRRKITSDFTSEDLRVTENLVKLLNTAFLTHAMNREEIIYLIDYKNGVQPILSKTKTVRPEINNILVVNHAQMATRMINGYFLGNPIQYILNGDSNKKQAIDDLNRYVQYEDKASVDKEIGDFQSICGTAYRIIYRDGMYGDEVPFEDKALHPANTFVVYENSIVGKPLVGVTYHNLYKPDGSVSGMRVYAYTEFGRTIFETKNTNNSVTSEYFVKFEPYSVGGVPIIEYPNNVWRIGDWELVLGLTDAINALHSGRLDDIDQIVQSLIVFVNAEIDSDRYAEMRKAGVVTLKNTTGNNASVDTIENKLDQSGMNMFAEGLEDLLYALIGIPSRNSRAGGGGDTGMAVELRDGWADLEIVARNKELVFKQSEKMALKIILTMFNSGRTDKLSLIDIDIKFTRNKNNNLLVKTQSYDTLLRTKTLTPADCLTIVDLVSDVNEYISRGESFWGEEFALKQPEQEVSKQSNEANVGVVNDE